jgi:hypothetical protein
VHKVPQRLPTAPIAASSALPAHVR